MIQLNHASRFSLPSAAPATFLMLLPLLLAGCSPAPVQATAVPAQPTSTPLPPTLVPPFPLAGTWSGTAVNGNVQMQVTLTIEAACTPGVPCGTFDIPLVPCAGTYVLAREENGQYEFDFTDTSTSCGEGRDYLKLLPDGTLQFISRGTMARTSGSSP